MVAKATGSSKRGGASGSLPDRMRAAVLRGPGAIAVEDLDVPSPDASEVLIEVAYCGVCGTDLHLALEGMGPPGTVQGHEYSGRIVALGKDVRGWSVGECVVGGPRAGCGSCAACRAGRSVLCRERPAVGGQSELGGAFAEYVRIPAAQLVPLPEGVSLRTAALAEPLAVALHALTRSGVQPQQRVLITGAGPLGLLVVAALRASGVDDIVVSEPAPTRRDRALQVGARRTCAPEDLNVPAMPFDLVPEPFQVAFDCSGRAGAIEAALAQLDRGGTLVLVGTGRGRPRLDHHRVLLNELVVTGAFNYDDDGFARALALLAAGSLPCDALIEPATVPLDGLLPAMQQLAAGQIAGKVLIVPSQRR